MAQLGQFVFFTIINNWLSNEIYSFQSGLLLRMAHVISAVALVVLTIWILFHGYRAVTGQSQQPLMALVGDSLRAVLIVMVATSAAAAGSPLFWTLTDGASTSIVQLVTGSDKGPFQEIDKNLGLMQIGMSVIDTIDDGGNSKIASDLSRDKWMAGIGVAGPAIIGGSLLLLYKMALALFIGLAPLFILCLLFKQTAQLFQKWLLYGIGTVFSIAVLSVMVSISMKMLAAVTADYTAQYVGSMIANSLSNGTINLSADGLNSMALQQGGIGLILTTLLISVPPMAASFFQGTLGQFQSYSPFGNVGQGQAAHRQQAALGREMGGGGPPGRSAGAAGGLLTSPSTGLGINTPGAAGYGGMGPGSYNKVLGSGAGGPGT